MNLNKIKDWHQINVIHCRDPECKGMLLESNQSYHYKCSDCGKYWFETSNWFACNSKGEPKDEHPKNSCDACGTFKSKIYYEFCKKCLIKYLTPKGKKKLNELHENFAKLLKGDKK